MTVLTIKFVNKDMKIKRQFCRQSCLSYFETFWWFSKFSFHRKGNDAWLLVVNWHIRVASGVPKQIKTLSVKSQNFIELSPSAQSSSGNVNFVSSSKKHFLKNRNWTFPVVRYFTRKLEFISNILWIIAEILFLWFSNFYLEELDLFII